MSVAEIADERPATYRSVREDYRRALTAKIEALNLKANVAELDMHGYTVLRDAASPAFFRELRERIHTLWTERKHQGQVRPRGGVYSDTILNCVSQGRVFEQALMNEKVNALTAYLLGEDYLLMNSTGNIMEQGSGALHIHTDNAQVPDPFPSWAMTVVSLWYTETVGADEGATRLIPGSHRYARHPAPGEGEDDAVALEVPAGSVGVWNGALWHGAFPRRAAGERVTFGASFCRLHMRPFADHAAVSDEIVERNGPLMARILGRAASQDAGYAEWRHIAARRL